jgi:hypothetical protein
MYKERKEDYQLVLTMYTLERLLYRLSKPQHADSFALKGAMLFSVWTNELHRTTRDIDLLGWGSDSISRLEQVFRQVCEHPVQDDGVVFQPDSIRGEEIREEPPHFKTWCPTFMPSCLHQ